MTQPKSTDATRSDVRLFSLLLLATVIVSQLALPFRLAGILFGLATAWVAVRALIGMARLRRAGKPAPGQVLVAAGLGLATVVITMLIAEAAYYPLVSELERCQAGANTETAERACTEQTRERLDSLLERLTSGRN